MSDRRPSTPPPGLDSCGATDDGQERRLIRTVEAFSAQPSGPAETRLCTAASTLLHTAGVAVSLGVGGDADASGLQTVCSTDGGRVGDMRQFDLGEGPAYTAHRTGRPVQVPDLAQDDTWPAFAEVAVELGFQAVFAFPLRSGSLGLGALTLYQQVTGALSAEQYADALVVARFALDLLSSLQEGQPPDELAQVFTDSLSASVEVHQASGVVAVQLAIPVDAALAVLRAHAFTEACSLAEIAVEVIDHRLQLGPLVD